MEAFSLRPPQWLTTGVLPIDSEQTGVATQ